MPRPLDEHRLAYQGWRVATAAAVAVFVGFASVTVYTFGVFLKPLTETFGWSRESVSIAFGVAAMTVAGASPVLGYLLDRRSTRDITVPCLIVFGIAFSSLAALTANLWHLYAIFFVIGLVGNGTAQLAFSRTVAMWFEQRRGLALAIVMMGGALGSIVLPPLAEFLITNVGWRIAFMALGTMTLAVGIPAALRITEPTSANQSRSGPVTGVSFRDAARTRAYWIVVVVLFGASIAQNGALTHLPALLSDRGVAPAGAAFALSALGVASLVGRLASGWLLDRFFAAHVAFGLWMTAALGTYVLAGADSLASGVFGAALIGFGMGGEADVTPYLIVRYFGLKSFSLLYATTWTFYAIAGAVGPWLMGRAFDATGSYESLLVRMAIVSATMAALLLALPTYDRRTSLAMVNLTEVDSPRATPPEGVTEIR